MVLLCKNTNRKRMVSSSAVLYRWRRGGRCVSSVDSPGEWSGNGHFHPEHPKNKYSKTKRRRRAEETERGRIDYFCSLVLTTRVLFKTD